MCERDLIWFNSAAVRWLLFFSSVSGDKNRARLGRITKSVFLCYSTRVGGSIPAVRTVCCQVKRMRADVLCYTHWKWFHCDPEGSFYSQTHANCRRIWCFGSLFCLCQTSSMYNVSSSLEKKICSFNFHFWYSESLNFSLKKMWKYPKSGASKHLCAA